MNKEIRAHSTASGSVVGPEADVVGPGGLFSKLLDEHGSLTRLMLQLRSAKDEAARREIYPTLRAALLGHERAEASVLYATLRQYSSTLSLAETHEREAEQLERAINRLDGLDVASEGWFAELEQLSRALRDHVEHEERNLFPAALAELGERVNHELRAEYFRVKQTVVNRIEAEFARSK